MSDPTQPASVYDLAHAGQEESRATFAVLVDNEPGVLHRVVGLFAARGYNIDSLTVAETDGASHTSRITIVTRGTLQVLSQIEAQLQKMVSTRHVQDVTKDPNGLERELALIKVSGKGEKRIEALRLAEIFGAKVIDASIEHFVFEQTGPSIEIERFIAIMTELGLVEVSRTGIAAMGRGKQGM